MLTKIPVIYSTKTEMFVGSCIEAHRASDIGTELGGMHMQS